MKKTKKAAVRLEQIDGLWTVFVVENGETTQRTFEKQEWAESFAEGQLVRLRFSGEQLRKYAAYVVPRVSAVFISCAIAVVIWTGAKGF
jgi:hypothetical protein